MRSSLLLLLTSFALASCGGRVGDNRSDAGTTGDGSVTTPGGSSGASGGSSGTAPSSGSSSSGGSGSGAGSSGGSTGCPSAPPAGTCSDPSQVCHYPGPTGETDCGCTQGQWQCFDGCSLGTVESKVDPAACVPQLRSTTSCNPYSGVCGFTLEVPCWGDGGTPLADIDAGLVECTAWCTSVAPPDGPQPVQCLGLNLVESGDGGVALVGTCNGCGI